MAARLPLPGFFVEEEDEDEATREDPKSHQGKIRSFAHVRGNWPTYLYIPVHLSVEMKSCIETLRDRLLEGDEKWELCDCPLHVSLSRTVAAKHHCIDPISSALRLHTSATPRFTYGLDELSFYANDDQTRSFLALDVSPGHAKLASIVRCVDQVLQSYRLPAFYKPPSFHASILWSLGNLTEKCGEAKMEELNEVWSEIIEEEESIHWGDFHANEICMKAGNKMFTFRLQ